MTTCNMKGDTRSDEPTDDFYLTQFPQLNGAF